MGLNPWCDHVLHWWRHKDDPNVLNVLFLKDVRAKFSNIDFFLKILPLKDDELAMSEM